MAASRAVPKSAVRRDLRSVVPWKKSFARPACRDHGRDVLVAVHAAERQAQRADQLDGVSLIGVFDGGMAVTIPRMSSIRG